MKQVDDAILNETVRRLVGEFHPEAIILFGSHAWGTPTDDSDLDLLVIVSESDEDPADRATRGYRLMTGLRCPVDILVKTRAEVERYRPVIASLTRCIMDKGRLLYGRREAGALA
jgi:predicted nucleotidyltransferase